MLMADRPPAGSGRARRHKVPVSPGWWLLLVGGLLIAGLVFRLQDRARELEMARQEEQQLRCDELARRINGSLLAARQLTLSLAALGAPAAGERSATERLLGQMMLSASDELISGMGLWYERGLFKPGPELHGPYLHRANTGGALVLTYEWSTEAYDYTRQPWYRLALANPSRQNFTEPYPDGDDVYMSSVAAMHADDGRVLGVASVDVTLSSLRAFFANGRGTRTGEIYVTTRNDRLLFHSSEDRLMAALRQRGFKGKQLLEAGPELLAGLLSAAPEAERATIAGWKVHLVAAGPGSLQELRQLDRLLSGALVAIVLLLGGALAVVYRRVRVQRRRQEALEADLQRRLAQERRMERRRRLLEAVVRRRTAELERINANKDRLMSMLAHDTRGDFMVIRSYAAMLGELAERQDKIALHEAGESLLASANHAYANFESILTWLESQSDGLECRAERLEVATLLTEACALAEPRAKLKGIPLLIAPTAVAAVSADRDMVATVLRNLLTNAIKFTAAGGRVEVRCVRREDAPGCAVFEVSDTGIGLSAAEAAALFQRKAVCSRKGTAGERGLGLGLSICQELCQRMRGRIWMESVAGRGTTVRFTLPLA